MWIVDPERAHAMVDPEHDDPVHLVPETLPIRVVEIEWIDVLVLLRRVLRILDRAVRPDKEPLGVLGHPRMVRGCLEREVERNLEIMLRRRFHEGIEVLEGTETRLDGIVPTFR